MVRPRWYKALNDLLGNKTRTLLIVLSMAVGLFAVGIILSASSILTIGLAHNFAAINPASGTAYTARPFDKAFLESVRAMPEVQAADARRAIRARAEASPGKWVSITIFAIADYNDMQVNKVTPQSGDWPPPRHEILIERSALPLLDVGAGESVRIRLADNTVRDIRIAGTAHDPIQVPARFSGSPYGYISFDTLEWLGETYGFNELQVVAAYPDDKLSVQHTIDLVRDKAEKSDYSVPLSMIFDPEQLPMNRVLQAILGLMGVLGLLALFLSVFLVVSTVSAMLAQQKRQIGVMKAVGGTSAQVFGMYLVMIMAYGVLSLAIAVPLGIVGAHTLSQMLAGFFNFDLTSMEIPIQAILLQIIVGLVLPVLASLLPFLSSLRISPAEAMSTYSSGAGRFDKGAIDRLLSGANVWFARRAPVRSLLLSMRNTFRSKGRLALTLITLTLGAATFIGVLSVRASLAQTVDDLVRYINFDVMLTFDRPYRSEELQQYGSQVQGVAKTDTLLQFSALRARPDGTESGVMRMFAPRVDNASLIRSPTITEGRWLLPQDDNAVVVDSGIMRNEPDLHVGDELVLKIDGQKYSFKIVGVSVGSTFASFIYGNYPYLARVTNRYGEATALMVTTETHDAPTQEAESAALDRYFEHLGLAVSSASTISSIRTDTAVIFDAIVALLLVMAVLMALVGGLGLMGTMSINVLERTREIGVLRAIGASNRGVAEVFILEGITIGVLSWLFGSVLAIPIGQGLGQAIGMAMMGVPLTFSYSMPGLFLWLGIVVLLSALASFIPARSASRLTVREVLAYE